jgi:hypothetical protein
MAASFDDEADIVFTGKIHCGGDVAGVSRGDGVNTGFGSPRVDPAQGLGHTGTVSDVVRILQISEESFAVRAL